MNSKVNQQKLISNKWNSIELKIKNKSNKQTYSDYEDDADNDKNKHGKQQNKKQKTDSKTKLSSEKNDSEKSQISDKETLYPSKKYNITKKTLDFFTQTSQNDQNAQNTADIKSEDQQNLKSQFFYESKLEQISEQKLESENLEQKYDLSLEQISELKMEQKIEVKSESALEMKQEEHQIVLIKGNQNKNIQIRKSNIQQQNQKQEFMQLEGGKRKIISEKLPLADQSVVITKYVKIFNKRKQADCITLVSSDEDEYEEEENKNKVHVDQKQNKITKNIGAMQYKVRDLENRKKYGHFSKDKPDIISNHKINSNMFINKEDVSELTTFNITQFLYKINWVKRPSGRIPLPSYFTYEEVFKVTPRLLLKYLERMALLKK